MSRSVVLDFWDESLNSGNGAFNSIAVGELVEVSYQDEVYKPAEIKVTIQNRSAGGGVAYSGVSHSSASPTIVTNNGHGLETNERISVTAESSGAIETKIYGVEKIDANTFYLKHYRQDPLTGIAHLGDDSDRINGDGTPTPTLSYVPTGKYSIDSVDVNEPDFSMGQQVVMWHFPEGFTKTSSFVHDGNASAITITYTSHPFADGDILQVVDETTGAVADDAYMVANETTNAFELTKVKSGASVGGTGTAGTLALYFNTKVEGFPLFLGTITNLQEEWHVAYGKTIGLEAKDHLQFLANTTAKAFNLSVAAEGETIGSAPRMAAAVERLTYLDADAAQDRFSQAISQMVDDFSEGTNVIHTDNTVDGSTSFTADAEKHEASRFVLTSDELTNGNFKKDISETNYTVLRVMQQLAMQDRHMTKVSPATGAAYGSGAGAVTITSSAHGLAENELIVVTNDSNASPPPAHIPDGVYRVRDITTNSFSLYTLDNNAVVQGSTVGTIDWQAAEDGNYGYDFFLDSGLYGIPANTGYTVGGTDYLARPHLNYFKRGYRQFRPDATSLNITLPMENNITEDGQTRIMYPDARFTARDDEVITEVELHTTTEKKGIFDFKGSLGHTMEAIRIKQIACKDNVGAESTAVAKADFAGRWKGDFHWGRHDSVVAHGTGVLTGRNDEPMLFQTGGSSALLSDTTIWRVVDDTEGSAADIDRLQRVSVNLMGGYQGGDILNTIPKISGYSGLSELPQAGRSIADGPGQTGSSFDDDVILYTTGVVDCDLIKSIKSVQQEGLLSTSAITVSPVPPTSVNSNSGGDLLINDTGHGLQTGAWIKVITGDILDGSSYWNNYYRVVYSTDNAFFITRPPTEAFDGITGSIPPTSDIYDPAQQIAYGGTTDVQTYKIAYNVFNGVGRVQYQTLNTRTEAPFTDNFILLSDRIKKDKPYAGVEVYAIDNRESSDTSSAGLSAAAAVMPDSTLYGADMEQDGTAAVPVRFRRGDKLSETRFLFADDAVSGSVRHLFKNTQAIITHSLTGDKNRSKSEQLSYSLGGSDFNEVRRTVASMLSRSSRDLMRGVLRIVEYPFIKLYGTAVSGTTSTSMKHALTTTVGIYGGRPGMLLHKTDAEDGNFVSGTLAEDITSGTVDGTLWNGATWAAGQFYRMYVHLRAGHSVRVTDPRSSVQSNMIVTKLMFSEGPGASHTNMEVIGFKDTATGFAVKPLGKINAATANNNRPQTSHAGRNGKARLSGITFSSG